MPQTFGVDAEATAEAFKFHAATPTTGPVHDSIRSMFRKAATDIVNSEEIPSSLEKTIALRKLQESMMYCNAAVAIHTPEEL